MTNPQPDEIERVARAMAIADGKDPDAPAWVRVPGNETFGICWRDQYAEKATAAIAAMDTRLREQIAAKDAEIGRLKSGLRHWRDKYIEATVAAALTDKPVEDKP